MPGPDHFPCCLVNATQYLFHFSCFRSFNQGYLNSSNKFPFCHIQPLTVIGTPSTVLQLGKEDHSKVDVERFQRELTEGLRANWSSSSKNGGNSGQHLASRPSSRSQSLHPLSSNLNASGRIENDRSIVTRCSYPPASRSGSFAIPLTASHSGREAGCNMSNLHSLDTFNPSPHALEHIQPTHSDGRVSSSPALSTSPGDESGSATHPISQSVPPELGNLASEVVFVLVCSVGQLLFAVYIGNIEVNQLLLLNALAVPDSLTAWLIGSFLLANGLSVVLAGSLADVVPPKRLMVGAFVWLTAWNVVDAFSIRPSRRSLCGSSHARPCSWGTCIRVD